MTDQVTIVKQLGQLAVELDQAVKDMGQLEEIAIEAEGDYKVAYSRSFREAAGPVEVRKQIATDHCDRLWRTWGKAAAAVRLQKEHIKALHSRIDVGRTLQATARAEIALAGTGPTP